jgi:hypothetical protein
MALRNLLDVSSVPVSWLFTANEVDQIHKCPSGDFGGRLSRLDERGT